MKDLEKYNKSYFEYEGKSYEGYCLHYSLCPGDTDYCRSWTEIIFCPELNALFVKDCTQYRGGGGEDFVKMIWDFKEHSINEI